MFAYLEGNEYAFQILVSRYQHKLVNYLNSLLRDYDLTVDVAQEAFIRVYRSRRNYPGRHQFSTWIYRIATNLAIDEMRRRRRRPVFIPAVAGIGEREGDCAPIPDGRPNPEGTLDQKERRQALSRALASLPIQYRLPFVLKEVQELSYEEVARVLNLSAGTVKSQTHRAKKLLREKLSRMLCTAKTSKPGCWKMWIRPMRRCWPLTSENAPAAEASTQTWSAWTGW